MDNVVRTPEALAMAAGISRAIAAHQGCRNELRAIVARFEAQMDRNAEAPVLAEASEWNDLVSRHNATRSAYGTAVYEALVGGFDVALVVDDLPAPRRTRGDQ